MSALNINPFLYRKYTQWVGTDSSSTDKVQPKVGCFVALTQSGIIHSWDYAGTGGDAIAKHVLVVDAKNSLGTVGVPSARVLVGDAHWVRLGQESFSTPIASLAAGDQVSLVDLTGGNAVLMKAASGKTVGNVVTVHMDDHTVVVELVTGEVLNPLTGDGVDSDVDYNNDGVVSRDELRRAVLDINEDSHTDIQDVIKIVNDEAIN